MKLKIGKIKEIARRIAALLERSGHSSHSKLLYEIAKGNDEAKKFMSKVSSVDIWGGAGSVFDIVIDDQKSGVEADSNKQFLELLLRFAECICESDASDERVKSSLEILKHWRKSGVF